MKCIQCNTDNNLKERTANFGRCKSCQHPFVFEPTGMPEKITDRFFGKVLEVISSQSTLYFTPKQLAYLLSRRSRKVNIVGVVFLYIFLTVFVSAFSSIIIEFSNTSVPLVVFIGWNLIYIFSLFQQSQSIQRNLADRRAAARSLQIIGGLLLLLEAFILISGSVALFNIFAILGLGCLAIGLGTWQLFRQSKLPQELLISIQAIEGWLSSWQRVNGPINQLQAAPQEQTRLVNSEITHYSFDRLVVCDRDVIAQLLIANNFHFENNCAVLSINGYPKSLFDTLMSMLRQNPDLKVYVLHDCSPKGVQVMQQLKTSSKWFRDQQVTIVDIGLLPRQILNLKDAFILQSHQSAKAAQELPATIRQNLSAEELQWLEAGFYVELESFTPQRLIQVLNRGIAGSRDISADGGDLILIGDSGIYASDSFG